MAKVVVFGIADFAELADFYIENHTADCVTAFTVDPEYIREDSFLGKPVVPFDELSEVFPPSSYKAFAPMSHTKMGIDRARVYMDLKTFGYDLISYVSPYASIFSEVGENCFILEDNVIQPFVKVGNNVVMWSGNHIGHHSHIHDSVFFTSHVVLSGHCVVEPGCFFGVNSTIRDGIHLGDQTLVGMGALITKNTSMYSVMTGSPAKPTGQRSTEVL